MVANTIKTMMAIYLSKLVQKLDVMVCTTCTAGSALHLMELFADFDLQQHRQHQLQQKTITTSEH